MRSDIMAQAQAIRAAMDRAGAVLTDEQAAQVPMLYQEWNGDGENYTAGDRRSYGNVLYRCITAHTSQPDWTPTSAPSLWAKVLIPTPSEIPEWEQPDSTNPYAKGDKVTHNGKTWVSIIDTNVWEPGIYGWEEVNE